MRRKRIIVLLVIAIIIAIPVAFYIHRQRRYAKQRAYFQEVCETYGPAIEEELPKYYEDFLYCTGVRVEAWSDMKQYAKYGSYFWGKHINLTLEMDDYFVRLPADRQRELLNEAREIAIDAAFEIEMEKLPDYFRLSILDYYDAFMVGKNYPKELSEYICYADSANNRYALTNEGKFTVNGKTPVEKKRIIVTVTPKPAQRSEQKSEQKSGSGGKYEWWNSEDPYDVDKYDDPEDFWYENMDDFDDFEDAWDYYDENRYNYD